MLKNLNTNPDISFQLSPTPEAIIFDWDNTIVNTWRPILEAMNHSLIAMGLQAWDFEEYKLKSAGRARADFFPEVFGTEWQKASDIFEKSFYSDDYMKHLELIDEMQQFIGSVSEKNIPLLVVSSKEGNKLRQEADALHMTNTFKAIIGAGDAVNNKPSKEIVVFAFAKAGIDIIPSKEQQVWFIGDAISDVMCAYSSGCVPVLYGEEEIDPSVSQHQEIPLFDFKSIKSHLGV